MVRDVGIESEVDITASLILAPRQLRDPGHLHDPGDGDSGHKKKPTSEKKKRKQNVREIEIHIGSADMAVAAS